LITGIGSARTERTLETFFEYFSNDRHLSLINIGVAGGDAKQTKVGKIYVINKIVEDTTGKTCLPDILFRHSLGEASLLSVNEPITQPSSVRLPLVDMEAASVWKVASRFLPPHRILFLKIVSDYCDGTPISTKEVQTLVQKNLDDILTLIRICQKEISYHREILTSEDYNLLIECRQVLRLTDTQYFRLVNLAEGYKIIHRTDIKPILKPYRTRTFTHKRERNRFFRTLCEQLTT
jgi:hypothetical protein